jgi:hypothetical protein
MKVLTVRNPHAWAIIYAGKTVENRDWDTSYRGTLLIHASASREDCPDDSYDYPDGLCKFPDGTLVPYVAEMVFGAIIGAVDLVDVVKQGHVKVKGNVWAGGPYCFLLENPRPLAQPYFCKSQLKLWELPASVDAAVKGQLRN